MTQAQVAAQTAGIGIRFFGWRVVGAAFVFAVFAWAIGFYGLSVLLHAVHERRGWSVSLVSGAITAHYLLGAVMVAWLDDAHRRFGLVAVTRVGVFALAAGTLGWCWADEPWQLFAASLLTAAGWAATSGAGINAMITPWFRRRRGFALSLAYNGASVGGVLFTPLWIALIAKLDLPGAGAVVAGAVLAVLWPLTGRYLRPTPALRGEAPDGDPFDPEPATAARADIRPPASRTELLRQRRFLTLSGAFALGLFAQVGLAAHLVTLLVPRLGNGGAAGAVSLTTMCAVIGRLLLGAVIDRVHRRWAAAANFLMQACGFLLLLFATDAAVTLLGCILFGLGLGNLVSLPPLIAEAEFDPVDVGRVVALVIAINQACFSFAPAVFGALHDLAGGYAPALALAAVLQSAAAMALMSGSIRSRAKEETACPHR